MFDMLGFIRSPLLLGVIMALGAVPASATVIQTEGTPAPTLSPILAHDVNFDNLPTGTQLTAGALAGEGIASITNNGLPLFTFAGTQSPPNYVGTGGSDGWAMDTTIVFSSLQSQIGFGDAGPNTTSVTLFDLLGNIIFQNTFASAPNDYWVFTSDLTNIASMEIASSFIAIDDLQFQNVPEPSSWLMLGLMCASRNPRSIQSVRPHWRMVFST